ncbi:MAG: hypothetical protein Kow0092_00760 [Deferrisomatales bacterium]
MDEAARVYIGRNHPHEENDKAFARATSACPCSTLAGPDAQLHPRCCGQLWLFEGAPPEAWEAVAKALVRRKKDAGDVLFRQGDPAHSMYRIKVGSIKVWKIAPDGREPILDIRKAGDLMRRRSTRWAPPASGRPWSAGSTAPPSSASWSRTPRWDWP